MRDHFQGTSHQIIAGGRIHNFRLGGAQVEIFADQSQAIFLEVKLAKYSSRVDAM